MSTEPRGRHPIGLFDQRAKRVFTSAQQGVETRGGNFLVSGLILLAAANSGDELSTRLLEAMGCDTDQLAAAVDAEWKARSRYLQDQPATLVNESFQSVAAAAAPDAELQLSALLAAMLSYPDSMASRLAVRVGADPTEVAERLTEV